MALVGAVPGRDEELKEFDIISEKIGRRNFVVSNVYVCALKTNMGERVKKEGNTLFHRAVSNVHSWKAMTNLNVRKKVKGYFL